VSRVDAHLLIETSGRAGFVGLVREGRVVQSAALDEARRHARDLAEKVRQLFDAESCQPGSVKGLVISLGPGSYTGLRVGLASAKAFAYAVGCPLVAVATFHAIANRIPDGLDGVEVVADGLQGFAYVQKFQRRGGDPEPVSELQIVKASDWIATLSTDATVSGPGVETFDPILPSEVQRLPIELRMATLESLWQASTKIAPVSRKELFRLEPLYLRGSSAEEKRKAQSASAAMASARVS